MEYDLFISHASEDKEEVARPLAAHLQKLGLRVWLDEFELTLGDSLRRTIDHGLSQSRYGLVILSPAFFRKEWPKKELDGLVAREDGGGKVVLPIWHNVSAADILKYAPTLADKVAVSTAHGLDYAAERVLEAVRRTSTGERTAGAPPEESEDGCLSRLRKQMLLSTSAWELRKGLYELESYLMKNPNLPEARLLKDQMLAAIQKAQAMERPDVALRPAAKRAPGSLPWLLVLAAVGVLIYIVLRILGIL